MVKQAKIKILALRKRGKGGLHLFKEHRETKSDEWQFNISASTNMDILSVSALTPRLQL